MNPKNKFLIEFTKPQEEEMVRLYTSGETLRTISGIYGIDPSTVRYRLMRLGVTMRARKRRCPYTSKQIKHIVAMRENGFTWAEVANEVGGAQTTARRWYIKSIGITSS